MNDAIVVFNSLIRDIALHYAGRIQLHAVWIESDVSICLVYSRYVDADLRLGRRLRFPPHAIGDDPQSTGVAAAEELLEPPGTLWRTAVTDAHGVSWLAVDQPPIPPYGSAVL
jgi:hypothetical protein